MIQSILSNLAVMLLGHLLMSTIVDYKKKLSAKAFNALIIFIFSSVIISIFYLPITFGENGEYRLDLRLIPLVFLAFFRGWKVALPVLVITVIWRLLIGGDGAIPGTLFGMIIPTLFALIFHNPTRTAKVNRKDFFIITICWFISDIPMIFFIPNGLEIFKNIFVLRYLSFIVVAFVYYTFIILAHKNEAFKKQLEFLASYDSLTNLLNRNTFLEKVAKKLQNNKGNHYIAMIDIDYFKKLNDTYGHLAGDKVLQQFAYLLRKYETRDIMFARYGGEEFIVHLQVINDERAIKMIDALQDDIRNTLFKVDKHNTVQMTASIGLAKFKKGSSLQSVISEADDNLYIAKERSRDQLVYVEHP